jgi:hypothetical protein
MKYALLFVALLMAGCDQRNWQHDVTLLCDPIDGSAWAATDLPGRAYAIDRLPSGDAICAKGKQ